MGAGNMIRAATFFQHAGIAMVLVFVPILANDITESFLEVGLIVAAYSLAQILSELYFGRKSDTSGNRMWFIRVGFVTCALVFGLHYFADDSLLLLLARVGAGITSGIMIPAFVAYSYEMSGEGRRAASVVSFHALGWMAGILATGAVGDIGLAFLLSSVFFLAGLALTYAMPSTGFVSGPTDGSIRSIISKNRFLFWAILLRHTAASAVWTILPVMLFEYMGAELYQISIIYIANTVTAFILMNLMAERIQLSDTGKLRLGLAGIVPPLLGFAFITEWWMAMPMMIMVGVSWAFLYVGGNFYLMEHNAHSTSTGLFSSTISVSTVIGPMVAGVIAALYGHTHVMYAAGVIAVAGFIVSFKIGRP